MLTKIAAWLICLSNAKSEQYQMGYLLEEKIKGKIMIPDLFSNSLYF